MDSRENNCRNPVRRLTLWAHSSVRDSGGLLARANTVSHSGYRRNVNTLLTLGLMLVAICYSGGSRAASTIPVAVFPCSTCNNQATLQAAALAYFKQWVNLTPPGYVGTVSIPSNASCTVGSRPPANATVVIVISSVAPLSGSYHACLLTVFNNTKILAVTMGVTNDAQAIAADNALFARSSKVGLIRLPSNLPLMNASDPIELTGAWLQTVGLAQYGASYSSLWHGLLTLNLPAVLQGTFINLTDGTKFTLWSGDTVQVTDVNGYTAKFQWNPGASPTWQFVSGSIRDPHGKPVPNTARNNPDNNPEPVAGGTKQPVGVVIISYPGGPPVDVTTWYGNPTPTGIITIGTAPETFACVDPGDC
jgi:hypothetical protein